MINLRRIVLKKNKKLNWEQQWKLMKSFPDPRDDIDRTYYQYSAINANVSAIEFFLYNTFSLFILPLFLLLSIYNRIMLKKERSVSAIFLQVDNPNGVIYPYQDFFPDEIKNKYYDIKYIHEKNFPGFETVVYGREAIHLWRKCVSRNPFKIHLNLLIFVHLMSLNGLCIKYNPHAIITYRVESDSTSSINTHFCESLEKKYICFMHGDYMLQLRQCFFRFSEFYIWDKRYIDIFKISRCADNQYIVITPPTFKSISMRDYPYYDLTYFFDGDHDNVDRVKDIIMSCVKKGMRCSVRPHPRFSNIEYIKETFADDIINLQDTKAVTIKESIENTRYVVGKSSTVLSQAYFAGCTIVIDDITDPDLYQELRERRSISIERPHLLLSEFIKR